MPAAATLFQQAWQAMLLQRLLYEAQLGEALWGVSIDTDPAALAQLVARGEGQRLFALQMGKQRQAVQALENPAIGTILLLAGVGLAKREEPSLPLQEQQLGLRTRPDSCARCIGASG